MVSKGNYPNIALLVNYYSLPRYNGSLSHLYHLLNISFGNLTDLTWLWNMDEHGHLVR